MQTDDLNRQAHENWQQKAEFWDELHGDDGNNFQQILVGPATERMLGDVSGKLILDACCGNGVMARRLTQLGATVTAFDFSSNLIEQAKARKRDGITYHVIDGTDEAAMLTLGVGQFDAVVCNMALMDMATIEPLFRAVHQLMKDDGVFVFNVVHPAFNLMDSRRVMERGDDNGKLVTRRGILVFDYLRVSAGTGGGAPGEPVPHVYVDRPISVLMNTAFAAGFVADHMEEPAFGEEHFRPNNPLAWDNLTQIPPVFGARLRKA